MRRLLFSTFLLCLFSPCTKAQTLCTQVPDFSDLSGPCVTCYTGTKKNPFQTPGQVYNRHTLITDRQTDPLTGGKLPTIPPGANYAVRLGNSEVKTQGEAVVFRFTVDADKSLLMVRFAVVFEDPGHAIEEQPQFTVRVVDKNGEQVEACASYDVSATSEIEGFYDYLGAGTPIRWRPWTSIGLNLEQYIGQEVGVEFISRDCGLSGHFGYAYFWAECTANQLSLMSCPPDSIELCAPFGFESYRWDNGDTAAIHKRKLTGEPLRLSCAITSVTGCQFTLNAYVHDTVVSFYDTVILDTVCQGLPYERHNFKLPPQLQYGDFSHINNYFDPLLCSGNRRALLRLTVLQTHYPLHAAICAGESYYEKGFSIGTPPPGVWRDSLRFSAASGCDSVVCLELLVSPSFDLPLTIVGPEKPCSNVPFDYYLPQAVGPGTYIWKTNAATRVVQGQGSPHVRLLFSDEREKDTVRLFIANGCGSGEVTKEVAPQKSYYITRTDTSCTGEIYNENGFSIPGEEKEGFYHYANRLRSQCDCDSVETLYLYVFNTPKIEIVADKELICPADSVSLQLRVESDEKQQERVNIGDILCTDGTIVSPLLYPNSGKVGEAVVFYVDNTRKHGWAISPIIDNAEWMGVYGDIPTIPNFINSRAAINMKKTPVFDTAGYSNTAKMREYGDRTICPAAWKIDFENGWYFPAAGQLRAYYSVAYLLNASIKLLGGNEHPSIENAPAEGFWRTGWVLSSSTEVSQHLCISISTGGFLNLYDKKGKKAYRAAKNF